MKKLALRLDQLQVETFTTGRLLPSGGTVHGHYGTTHTQAGDSCPGTCQGADTCFVSCRMTECWQGNQCVVW